MPDDKSPEDFAELLIRKGWDHTRQETPDKSLSIFIVKDYEVTFGQNSGKRITVAFPIPRDYPSTAPYGMHVKTNHGLVGNMPNIQASPLLGNEWQFWSRRISNWPIGRRNSGYYIDNVNRWLEAT